MIILATSIIQKTNVSNYTTSMNLQKSKGWLRQGIFSALRTIYQTQFTILQQLGTNEHWENRKKSKLGECFNQFTPFVLQLTNKVLQTFTMVGAPRPHPRAAESLKKKDRSPAQDVLKVRSIYIATRQKPMKTGRS